jgi:PE-PPE domain
LYPLNLIADLNAIMGVVYVHEYAFDLSLPRDPTKTSPAYEGTHGDTDYYFFENEDLPLFGPLRTLGVPEPLIDVVEPFFREIVELGYDRSIRPWEPTPARLIPVRDPAKVAADLIGAIGEGIDNARDIGDGVSLVLSEVGSQLPPLFAVKQEDPRAGHRTVDRELTPSRDRVNKTVGAVRSVIGNGRTVVRSAGDARGVHAATVRSARKTPVRDAVKKVGTDIKEVVDKVSDTIKAAMHDSAGDDGTADEDEGAAD